MRPGTCSAASASAAPSTPTTPATCPSERSTANSRAATFRCVRERCGECCTRPPPARRRSWRSTSSSSTSQTGERPSAPKAARSNGCTGVPAPPTCSHGCCGSPTEPAARADCCSSPSANQPRPGNPHRVTSARTMDAPGSDTTAPASSYTPTPAGPLLGGATRAVRTVRRGAGPSGRRRRAGAGRRGRRRCATAPVRRRRRRARRACCENSAAARDRRLPLGRSRTLLLTSFLLRSSRTGAMTPNDA